MRTRLLLPGASVVVVATACNEGSVSTALVAPHTQGASVSSAGHQVAGSGHVEQGAGIREFTFHALELPDGGTEGSFKIVLASGLFFEADVTCMAVSDNTGWVAGTIRATNAAIVVIGSTSMFYAIDNGEGSGAGDIVSVATFNGAAGADVAFCNERPLALAPMAVTNGNVQVR